MSNIALTPNDNGTGTFTLASPDSDTNRTFILPDSDGELLTSESTLSSDKLTGALPAIDGSALTGIISAPVTPTPTLTSAANLGTFKVTHAVTVNNHASYLLPIYTYYVTDANDVIMGGVLTQTTPSIAIPTASLSGDFPHTVNVYAEEAGKVVSAAGVTDIAQVLGGTSFRYYRLVLPAATIVAQQWRMFSGLNQSGTDIAASITSTTIYSTYYASNARDNNYSTFSMTHQTNPAWFKLDLGASFVEVKSIRLKTNLNYFATMNLEGSNTGAFSGEETVILDGSAGDWGIDVDTHKDADGAYLIG